MTTLAEYCASHEDIDDDTVRAVRRHLLDWVGLVAGGRHHAQSSESVLSTVDALASGPIQIGIPTGRSLAPDRAALLSGTFAHSLDYDDTHLASSLHPGAPVIATTLALARSQGASGKDVLAAISLGYDVTVAVGRAIDPAAHYDRGFHVTATCGTFGAVAAAGSLLGFDDEAFESAFGVAGSQAAGSLQFLENGAWNKRLHPGLAAQRGVQAASLVDNGFRGSTSPFTGEFGFLASYTDTPHPEHLDGLESGRAVAETGLKPYPCCRYMHPAIDGFLAMTAEVDTPNITSIEVDLPRSGVRLTGQPIERKRRPGNFVDCQFSMPFATALAIREQEATIQAFLDAQEALDEPAMLALMDRVEVISTDRTNDPFPERWSAHITIDDGSHHERYVERPRGEPERPLDDATLDAKVRELLVSTPLADRTETIIETVRNLGDGVPMGDLFAAIEES